MSRHPSEPPADWPPSPDDGTAHPAPGDALPRRVPPKARPAPQGAAGWFTAPDGQPGNGNGTGDHEPLPGYPAPPGYPPAPGYLLTPEYPPTPDYPPAPGYPAAAGHPGYPPGAGGTPGPGYPGYSHYPGPPGQPVAPGQHAPNGHQPPVPASANPETGTGPAIAHDEYAPGHEAYGLVPADNGVDRHGLAPDEYGVVYDDYGLAQPGGHPAAASELPGPAGTGPGPGAAAQSDGSAARWAMLCYLTVPLFGFVVPLLVYLRARRDSRWARAHAAQALNVWITVLLYALSVLIMGTMLALDSPQIALIVFAPLALGLWLVMLILLVRAATAASQGEEYTFPRWLCSPIVR